MIWVLANWRLVFFAGALLTAFSAGWHVSSKIGERRLESSLNEQKAALEKQCQENVKITQEASDAYQKKLAAANRKLADFGRMYQGYRVQFARPTSRSDAASGGNINAGSDGIAASALFDEAGRCEQYRLQVIGLQGFINQVWEAKQ